MLSTFINNSSKCGDLRDWETISTNARRDF